MEDRLLKYFPNLTVQQIEKFSLFSELFLDWNSKINLISRKDSENLFEHHILHSLSIAKFFDFAAHINIIDVGTGGGFPGIPLALYFPNVNFTLVDSIAKKINVVKDISEKLGLQNVKAINARAETLKPDFDFIVCRAVTNFNDFYQLTKKLFRNGKNSQQGMISLKGGDIINETSNFKNIIIYSISDVYEEVFFETKKIIFLQKNFAV